MAKYKQNSDINDLLNVPLLVDLLEEGEPNPAEELSEELNNCEYTAVNASSGSEFGAKSLKPLSGSASVKRLGITINNVVFTDGQEWASDEGELIETKIDVEPLASALSDEEIEAYRTLTNPKMQYVPFGCAPSWICSCGELNYDNSICTACGSEKTKVFEFVEKENLHNTILENKYEKALRNKKIGTISSLQQAITQFEELGNYKDSGKLLDDCKHELVSVERAEEEKKQEEERQAEIRKLEAEEKAKKNKKIVIILATVAVICLAGFFVATNVIIPNAKYNAAVKLMENGEYDAAIDAFEELDDYKDSAELKKECEKGSKYKEAQAAYDEGNLEAAYSLFMSIKEYSDSKEKAFECAKKNAEQKKQNGDIKAAIEWYRKAEEWEAAHAVQYDYVKSNLDRDNEQTYEFLLELCESKYSDSQELYDSLYGLKLTAVFNTDEDDTETDMESIVINSSKFIYLHLLIEGGIPNNEYVNLSYKFYRPSNEKGSMDEWSFYDEVNSTVSIGKWTYLRVLNNDTTFKAYAIEVFESSTDELIGRFEVSLVE